MPFLRPLKISPRTSCDVLVRFDGNVVKFPCNKNFLCRASRRFKEELSVKNGQVIITKMSPEIASIMLRFINKDILEPMPWKKILDLLKGALFYEVTSLITACSKRLELKLDLSNAGMLLELASVNSLPSLYASSLKVCSDAAFHIMDAYDFNDLLPSTVMTIVSEENLQVPNEAFVLHCLWIRATVEACRWFDSRTLAGLRMTDRDLKNPTCRNDLDLTLPNIAKFFEPFSLCVEYEDVVEDCLSSYGNERLMEYFRGVKGSRGFRIFPTPRKISFPLNMPNNSYVHYTADSAEGLASLREGSIEFSVKTSAYLIEFRLACEVDEAIEKIVVESKDGGVILIWDAVQGSSNISLLPSQKRVVRFPKGEFLLTDYQVSVTNLVKLHRTKVYSLRFESGDNKWPIMKNNKNPCIEIHNSTVVGLTRMTCLPCPSFGE